MSSDFCVEALQEALTRFGKPGIFNTDQGSQFTAELLSHDSYLRVLFDFTPLGWGFAEPLWDFPGTS